MINETTFICIYKFKHGLGRRVVGRAAASGVAFKKLVSNLCARLQNFSFGHRQLDISPTDLREEKGYYVTFLNAKTAATRMTKDA